MWWVLTRYTLVYLWNEFWHHSTKTEALQNSGGEMCVGRGLCWYSGVVAHHITAEASLTKKAVLRAQGCGVCCKQVRQPVSVLSCFLLMGVFWGGEGCWLKGNVTSQLLCFQRGIWILIIRPLHTHTHTHPYPMHFFQMAVSMLFAPRSFACLLFWGTTVPSGLYPSQTCWPLKLQALSLTLCKNPKKLSLLIFQANGF